MQFQQLTYEERWEFTLANGPIMNSSFNLRGNGMNSPFNQLDSKKQVYQEMFRISLIHLRANAAKPWYRRLFDRSTYEEVELLHNLPVSMLDENFVNHDIWFLNHQAKKYYELEDRRFCPLYTQHIPLISRLFSLVPDEMRSQLLWSGPGT